MRCILLVDGGDMAVDLICGVLMLFWNLDSIPKLSLSPVLFMLILKFLIVVVIESI